MKTVLTVADSGYAKQLFSLDDTITNLNGVVQLVKTSATNLNKLAFRVALMNWRESRNDAKLGDGYTRQLFAGAVNKNIPASWESTTTQALYDKSATTYFTADEFSVLAEVYLRKCHAINVVPSSFS